MSERYTHINVYCSLAHFPLFFSPQCANAIWPKDRQVWMEKLKVLAIVEWDKFRGSDWIYSTSWAIKTAHTFEQKRNCTCACSSCLHCLLGLPSVLAEAASVLVPAVCSAGKRQDDTFTFCIPTWIADVCNVWSTIPHEIISLVILPLFNGLSILEGKLLANGTLVI